MNKLDLHLENTQLARNISATFSTDISSQCSLSIEEFVHTGALLFWLERFLDIARERWNAEANEEQLSAHRSYVATKKDGQCHATRLMSSLTEASQSTIWNQQLLADIRDYRCTFGYVRDSSQVNFFDVADLKPMGTETHCAYKKSANPRIRVGRTYLPKLAEVFLAVSLGNSPIRWREPEIEARSHSVDLRSRLNFRPNLSNEGTFEHFIRMSLPRYLPMSLVEYFDEIQLAITDRIRNVPDAFFTAHLHLASDSFLIWAVMQRKRGMKLLLSQHGGFYGQGMVPTRDAEFEYKLADHYFHWGWVKSATARRIPSQLNVWARRRKRSNHLSQLLLITDCTFRYSRRPWPTENENAKYKNMLLETYAALDPEIKKQTLVRLHHHHDVYDQNHEVFWSGMFPNVRVNNGLDSIWKLRRKARVIVCTSLGTSEIEQFGRRIPTILRLDPEVHTLHASCIDIFGEMERVGLVHWTTESFAQFINSHWADIDSWWARPETQNVVSNYLLTFGYMSARPLQQLRSVLLEAARASF